ncbi:MAG TPA: TlpA disulfide reductase family protein [Urbifossiella sp.]|nr:TlpA disulfide reductase family protein [Urbifossiella sp.]
MRIVLVATISFLMASKSQAGEPLSIGSPAPPFKPAGFVKGDTFSAFARWTIYVVEFSAVQCVPCAKAFPVLTALQKKHPAIVVVSVYGDPEAEVRQVVEKHKEAIGFRVALDHRAQIRRSWMDAAGRDFFPAVFVVGRDGLIAWIGNPLKLAEPFEKILAGTYDPRFEKVRLSYQMAHSRSLNEGGIKAERITRIHRQVNEAIAKKKWADALYAIADGRKEDPKMFRVFDLLELEVLVADPSAADRALDFAIKIAAAAMIEIDPLVRGKINIEAERLVVIAIQLLGHGVPGCGEGDQRLAYLSGLLIDRARLLASVDKPREAAEFMIEADWWDAEKYHRLGQHDKAVERLEHALKSLADLRPPSDADEAKWQKARDERIKRFHKRREEFRDKIRFGK